MIRWQNKWEVNITKEISHVTAEISNSQSNTQKTDYNPKILQNYIIF
jgi:hypothetical protein